MSTSSSIVTENRNLFSELADLKIDVSAFSEEKIQDLLERLELGDIQGFCALAKIPRNHALLAMKAFYERGSVSTVRRILRTADARKLAREILAIFSREASSSIAREGLSLFDQRQTLPRDLLRQNLESWELGARALEEVEALGLLGRLRSLLSQVELEVKGSPGVAPKRIISEKSSPGFSDAVIYFVSRRKVLETVLSIFDEFGDAKSLTSLLAAIDQNALREVVHLLEGLARLEIPDAYAAISDAELEINQRFQKGGGRRAAAGGDQYAAKSIIEDKVREVAALLKMNLQEENKFVKAVAENLSIPIELNTHQVRAVIDIWQSRLSSELEGRVSKTEASLKKYWSAVSIAVEKVVKLDQEIAVATMMRRYSLTIPAIGTGGIGFVNGRNILLLLQEGAASDLSNKAHATVVPISYSVGKTISVKTLAPPRNVVMLTGANSGGKTTLLTTVATIHLLTLLGLPVPADSAEVNPVPIYLFRRRTTKRVGSLEQALRSLIPVFADTQPKLILLDEFEALTEPGAAGRIVASI